MSSHEELQNEHTEEHASMSKGAIWKVFFILLAITVVEFIIALAIPKTIMPGGIKNFVYIVLTLVKAFYIVAYFMHLKFEKYAMKVAILVSLVFIIYFIILMLNEGNYINGSVN